MKSVFYVLAVIGINNMESEKIIQLSNKKWKETSPYILTMYEFVRNTKPETIFEIGTRNGISTQALLSALADNRKGKLYSVDIKDCMPRVGLWMTDELAKYWEFHRANSIEFHKTWNKEIDILLIDGDHSYEMCKADFENYEKFVRKGGYIFMHDTIHWEGVRRFFPEIKYPKINLTWSDGMGIIQKI